MSELDKLMMKLTAQADKPENDFTEPEVQRSIHKQPQAEPIRERKPAQGGQPTQPKQAGRSDMIMDMLENLAKYTDTIYPARLKYYNLLLELSRNPMSDDILLNRGWKIKELLSLYRDFCIGYYRINNEQCVRLLTTFFVYVQKPVDLVKNIQYMTLEDDIRIVDLIYKNCKEELISYNRFLIADKTFFISEDYGIDTISEMVKSEMNWITNSGKTRTARQVEDQSTQSNRNW